LNIISKYYNIFAKVSFPCWGLGASFSHCNKELENCNKFILFGHGTPANARRPLEEYFQYLNRKLNLRDFKRATFISFVDDDFDPFNAKQYENEHAVALNIDRTENIIYLAEITNGKGKRLRIDHFHEIFQRILDAFEMTVA